MNKATIDDLDPGASSSPHGDLTALLHRIVERFAAGATRPREQANLAELARLMDHQPLCDPPRVRALLARLSHDGYLRGALVVLADGLARSVQNNGASPTAGFAQADARRAPADRQVAAGDPALSPEQLEIGYLLAHELTDALAPELGMELATALLATPSLEQARFRANSNFILLHRLLAHTNCDLGDWPRALRHFEAIIATNIDDAAALAGWARCSSQLPASHPNFAADSEELFDGLAELQSDDMAEHPRYELGRPLGRGRHAIVYAAYDRRAGRDVAIKRLLDRRGTPSSSGVGELGSADARQFFAEAQTLAAIRSPQVVSILDVQIEHRFIALELCRGGSLRMALRRKLIDRSRLRAIADQLRLGLAAIHAAGAVHRDVKPANLLFRDDGPDSEIALADFGIAVHQQSRPHKNPRRAGTLRYLAPELRRGESASPASDLYGAGVVLLEIALAPEPLPSTLSDALDSLDGIGEPLPWIPDDLPISDRKTLMGLLAVDPQQRHWAKATSPS